MKLEAIMHIPLSQYAFALTERTLVIRLRTGKNDVRRCELFYGDRVHPTNPIQVFSISMKKVASDALFDYYEAELVSDYTRVCYYFYLEDESTHYYYYGQQFLEKPGEDRTEYFQFPYIRREDMAIIPDWAKDAVMYQIFPDSFATEKGSIAQQPIEKMNHLKERSSTLNGGTLKGIEANLNYIEELGINCIYLNPIFVAGEYHKYDIMDYFDVDPCFGTKQDLKELVAACHKREIKVILDGVFNHCGAQFFAFKDVLEKGEMSPYKDWFYSLKFPIEFTTPPNYEAFAYVKEMPKLNTGHPAVIDYFCKVGTYWLQEADIDGWRLDVANEVNHDFWRAFRKAVKAIKSEAFLIGEIWEDSEVWLQGEQFDSTMNYRFTNLCREFFAKGSMSVTAFNYGINQMLMRYQRQVTYAQMNLIDSHDVPRFLHYAKEDERKLSLAALFLLTFVGVPSILYGDELLISGEKELEYRKPMIWHPNTREQKMIDYYKALISLRKSSKAFTSGTFKVIIVDEAKGLYVFERREETERFWVILANTPNEATYTIPAENNKWQVAFGNPETITENNSRHISLNLKAYEGLVLKQC